MATGEAPMSKLDLGPAGVALTVSDTYLGQLGPDGIHRRRHRRSQRRTRRPAGDPGDPGTIATRIGQYRQAGADDVMLHVLNDGDQPGPMEVARRLADGLLAGRPSAAP
jgi:hypothetical protein